MSRSKTFTSLSFLLISLALGACGTSHGPGPDTDGGGVETDGGGGGDPDGGPPVWTRCEDALAGGTTGEPCSFSGGCGEAACCTRMASCVGGSLVVDEVCPPGCGACATSAECADDEYCAHPIGACAGPGYCDARPTGCARDCPGVCGCDGVTYCNECNANEAGVAVASYAACPTGRACGGRGTPPCAGTEYCDWADSSCGRDDGTGTCEPRPMACPDIYAPVCGCDGVTYSNACDAAGVGVDFVSTGECDEPPPPSGDCRMTGCPMGTRCEPCWTTWACLPPGAVC